MSSLIFQEAALARPKGAWPVVANHRLSAAFSFSRRFSPPKVFEPTSFQLVVVQSTATASAMKWLVSGISPGVEGCVKVVPNICGSHGASDHDDLHVVSPTGALGHRRPLPPGSASLSSVPCPRSPQGQLLMKARRSALITSACVVHIPCGNFT